MTIKFLNGDIPFDDNAIAFLARIIQEQIAEDMAKEPEKKELNENDDIT